MGVTLNCHLYNWKFGGVVSAEDLSDEKPSSKLVKEETPLLPNPDKGIVEIAVAATGLILLDVRYATPSRAPPCKPTT